MNKNLTHQIPRAALTLLLMLTLALSASATNFITDVMLLGHDNQTTFNDLKSSLVSAGWTDINQDLNAGAGGHYIHLLYKTQTSMDNTGVPITDFYIKTGEKYPVATVEHGGRTYYLVPCQGSDNFVNGQGDLNEGCGQNSDYIHLYYTKDALSDNTGVTDITFNSTQSGGVGANGNNNTGYDLNSGAHGDYIYMHFTTATGANVVTLSSGSGNVQLQNGHILTGTGGSNTHVTIAAGATVTLSNVNITAIANNNSHQWAGITCLGNAVIVLNEGTTNSVKGGYQSSGIYVPQDKTLTLQGSGTLNATGTQYAAGIGGDYTQSCGTITITGGTVTATGGQYAAGIGSGPEKSCGSINITGGTITATGGPYAAGIGSGYNHSSCWHIAITGGTVTATGSTYAAGIGSGFNNSSCQDISITNGVTTVTATNGTNSTNTVGAGYGSSTCGMVVIGGRETGFITKSPFVTFPYTIAFDVNDGTGILGHMTVMHDIATNLLTNDYTLSGYMFYGWATSPNGPKVYDDEQSVINLTETPADTVTLYAKWRTHMMTLTTEIIGNVKLYDGDTLTGAGGPEIRVSIADGATVTFSGVDITAIANSWPGITCLGNATIVLAADTTNSVKGGQGNSGIYVPNEKTLTIQGSGTLNATGGQSAAGIGIGSGYQQTCGNITISGGTVTANGGQFGAGIGGGSWSSCGNITISGGTVTATGGSAGAGIGSSTNGSCGDITISGGTVTATGDYGAAGIGSGYQNSSCGNITITNGVSIVTVTKGADCNNAIGAGYSNSTCGTVTIGGVQTGFITQSPFTTFPYTVAFDANGGTGTMDNQVFMHKVAQSLAANSFTLLGAEFEGWATTPDGPKVYNDGQSVNNLTQTSGTTVTLYAKWITHLSVDGNEYTIHTATGWDVFCDLLANNSNGFFTGKTVKLADDITVTSMAGSRTSDSNYLAFTGTFDGQGHTLTLNYSSNISIDDGAPFRVIDGATLQNLHIAGTINTSHKFNGVVGHAYGINSLTNCRSSITINSSVNGDGTHGGFVGVMGNGTTTFTGCVFDGRFTSTSTTRWGGFVGFVEGNNQAHANFTNCLFAPANSTFGFNTNESQTFARLRNNSSSFATFSNSYYTKVLGDAQGKQARSITGIKSANVAFNGEATTYNVSGITAYSVGMKYAGTCYAGNGETVSLNLTHDDYPGYTYGDGYMASAGNLNGTGNPYTLTMPNVDVTIEPVITAYTVSAASTPDIEGAAQVSLDNTNWSSSVIAAEGDVVYFKTNVVIGYNSIGYIIKTENGDLVNSANDHFTMPAANVTYSVDFNTDPYYSDDRSVTLSPGIIEGNPFVYFFDPAAAAPNVASAENLQFYYVNYNTIGFRLSYDYCPSSFTVPNGVYFIGWDGWSNNGYITLTSTETTFTAQWGNPMPPLTPSTYIDGNGEYHTCSNYTVLTGGQGQTTLEGGWYVVDSNITYSNDEGNALNLNGDVTLILCNGKTMTVTTGGVSIQGNGHTLTIYGQSLDPNVAGTLNVNSASNYAIDGLSTYTQHSGKVTVSSPIEAIQTQSFTLNGGSLEASGYYCGISTWNGGDLTINGGTVTATSTQTEVGYAGLYGGGNVVINGGKVEANKIFANYNITLGYTYPDDYIKSDNFYYYSGSGTVSVKSGQSFYYKNGVLDVTVSGNIANPNSTIAGKTLRPYIVPITVTKEIAGYGSGNGGWHLIASPLQGNNYVEYVSGLISNTASHYDLYRFNQEANKEWENYKANSPTNHPDFITLRNGRGYLYAHSTDTTLTFIGVPYSGNGVVDLTYSEVNPDENMHGWNLVGNPFCTAATVDMDFYVMNPETHNEIIVATGSTVEAMEGIFVKATAPNQSVTFTQATAPLKSPQRGDIGGFIVLDLGHGGAVIDRAIVRLGEGQTLPKFQIRDNSTKIYIPQDGEDYAVVTVGGTDGACTVSTEIPVNFKAEENGTYTLTANIDNMEMSYLHLVDNMTGADVDLLDSPEYTFTAKTTDYTSRFKLVFVCGDANDDPAAPFAYVSNGNIVITADAFDASLQVVDMMGRVIRTVGLSQCGSRTTTAGMPAGVYVLRLIDGNDVRVQKIVIR